MQVFGIFKTCRDLSLEQPLQLIRFYLDLIFKVTIELNMNNLVCVRPLERVRGFSSNLMRYFIGTTFRANGLGHLDLIFKVTVGLTTTRFSQIKLVCTVYQEYLLVFLPNLHRNMIKQVT